MPYYEFECTECHEPFAVKMTFEEHDEPTKVVCPKCGSSEVERVLTPVSGKTSRKS